MKSLKKVEGINVVPLIDIMLVLLAIILTISSFIALGKIELSLPSGESTKKLEAKSFTISIDKNKQFFINDKPIDKTSIETKIIEIKKEDSVTIRADRLTPYGEFVFIIDILKSKGIEKIGMVVEEL